MKVQTWPEHRSRWKKASSAYYRRIHMNSTALSERPHTVVFNLCLLIYGIESPPTSWPVVHMAISFPEFKPRPLLIIGIKATRHLQIKLKTPDPAEPWPEHRSNLSSPTTQHSLDSTALKDGQRGSGTIRFGAYAEDWQKICLKCFEFCADNLLSVSQLALKLILCPTRQQKNAVSQPWNALAA